ncbi:MAG: lipopolysaccharide heptosyltransferase I [Burkholderiales bacterium]
MLKILLVKTSSMGDVIHNLPVVSDIRRYFPEAKIDWVVEETYQAVPMMHVGVSAVLPVALRRWRKTLWQRQTWRELTDFRRRLRHEHYDFILDSQGLIKSALITRFARGVRCGLNWKSAREPLSWFYDRAFDVPWSLHAVERNRSLAAQALGYALEGNADYGMQAQPVSFSWLPNSLYAVLLHATSSRDKLWPEARWIELGVQLNRAGLCSVLPWGNENERMRSTRLADQIKNAVVPPQLDLNAAAALLASARGVIGVDTGLAHLAAALKVPVAGIYCATEPSDTGIYSQSAVNLGGKNRPPSVSAVAAAVDKLLAACSNVPSPSMGEG